MARRHFSPPAGGNLQFRLDECAIPDRATCIEMFNEILEEADAGPHYDPAPELTARYRAVMHWRFKRSSLPAGLHADSIEKPMAAVGVALLAEVQLRPKVQRK